MCDVRGVRVGSVVWCGAGGGREVALSIQKVF